MHVICAAIAGYKPTGKYLVLPALLRGQQFSLHKLAFARCGLPWALDSLCQQHICTTVGCLETLSKAHIHIPWEDVELRAHIFCGSSSKDD